ncbi:MAG TPA: Gfo/Idh/MocA family oxidoreductase [Jiangellaceae bacterium]
MTRRRTIVIVGTGGIADIHANDIAKLDGRAEIVAAVDTDPERLSAFTKKWSVPRSYADIATMLDEERPDVVDLCTPPALHAVQARAGMERGLTVLCEKPPTLSLAELDELTTLESVGEGRFAAVVQHRFGSGARKLRGLVADARLGQPTVAVCNTLWFRPDDYFAVPWRGKWEIEGGGPTMGHGIHQMDLLLSILGPWRRVTAVAERRARPTDTEDISAAIVTFDSGAVATIINSLLSPRETSYLRFDFAHATVELEHLYGYGDDNWTVTPVPGHEDDVAAAWNEGPSGQPSGHRAQISAVLDALDAGVAPPVTAAQIRPTMDLVTAIYASAFTGRPVEAGEIGPDSPFYRRLDGPGAPWLEKPEPAPNGRLDSSGVLD